MKFLRKMIFGMLMLISANTVVISAAAAASMEYQDLQVMVKMDKEQYEEGEPITATITAVNTGSKPITIVNLEQLIPEGYVLAEDSRVSAKDVEMKPGQTIELRVTFVGDTGQTGENAETGTFWDKLFYGETLGIPNIILVVIMVIIIIVFMALT